MAAGRAWHVVAQLWLRQEQIWNILEWHFGFEWDHLCISRLVNFRPKSVVRALCWAKGTNSRWFEISPLTFSSAKLHKLEHTWQKENHSMWRIWRTFDKYVAGILAFIGFQYESGPIRFRQETGSESTHLTSAWHHLTSANIDILPGAARSGPSAVNQNRQILLSHWRSTHPTRAFGSQRENCWQVRDLEDLAD